MSYIQKALSTTGELHSAVCIIEKSLITKEFVFGDVNWVSNDGTLLAVFEDTNVTIKRIVSDDDNIPVNTQVTISYKVTTKGWRSGIYRGEERPPRINVLIYTGPLDNGTKNVLGDK